MKYLTLLFLFLNFNLNANEDLSFRLMNGKITGSDLNEMLSFEDKPYKVDAKVTALDIGYLLKKNAFELPIDFYVKGGLAYFDEANAQDDVFETTLYIKAYWNIDFLENRVRIGLGEGISYTNEVLYYEKDEASENQDNTSRFLNYLDLSLDFDVGKLVKCEPLHNTYLGITIKHRSGIFGLINNVEKGGNNYYGLSLEINY